MGFISSLLPGHHSASEGRDAAVAARPVPPASVSGGAGLAGNVAFPAAAAGTPSRVHFSPSAADAGAAAASSASLRLIQFPPMSPVNATANSAVGSRNGGSALDVPAPRSRTSSHASRVVGRRVGERDADFEFFALTLLCVKIHCGRRLDDGGQAVYTLSTQDLWLKAKEQQVQFHQYYAWLEEQINAALAVGSAPGSAAGSRQISRRGSAIGPASATAPAAAAGDNASTPSRSSPATSSSPQAANAAANVAGGAAPAAVRSPAQQRAV